MSISFLQKGRGMSAFLAGFLSLALFTSLSLAAPNPPSPPAVPTLGTPTMSPVSPYNPNSNESVTFTYTVSGLGSDKAMMNYSILEGAVPKVTTFTSVPVNPVGNGTYTVTWNGKLDGNGKPADNTTYTFKVWGYYGPGNMASLGSKTIDFTIDTIAPSLAEPVIAPTTYYTKMNTEGVKISTSLSNLYAADGEAHLVMTIHKDSVLNPAVATFTSDQTNGPFEVTWKNANAVSGKYFVVVGGQFGNSMTLDGVVNSFMVDDSVLPFIDSLTVIDNPFDYTNNNTVDFGYKLSNTNGSATVNTAVYVKDNDNNASNDALVYQWPTLMNQNDGVKTLNWNGKASNNVYVTEGSYYFKVWGQVGNTQLDPKQIDFSVDVTPPGQAVAILNLKATPSTFSPNGDGVDDSTNISFNLSESVPHETWIKVGNDNVLLASSDIYGTQVDFTWDGKIGNKVVDSGPYTITVKAIGDNGSDLKTVVVNVNNLPAPIINCGYPDVKLGMAGITTQICDAFKFTRDRGIFLGDDGTGNVRPFDVINRVESAAVIMRGFDMPLLAASAGNEGFSDVLLNQWYMKTGVVRSAKQYGVLKGYPDGTLRPAQQVIRAELVVMFVRASGKLPGDVSVAPFADTSVNESTNWYIKSVNGAKIWNWIPATTNFFPTQGMTRADVAKLFYAAYQAGNAGL